VRRPVKNNRCPAYKIEGDFAWQCQLRAGHSGEHVNYSGHLYWGGEFTDLLDSITTDLWRAEQERGSDKDSGSP
jgi:hypothetical protein